MRFIRERINKLAAELMVKSNRRALCAWIIENSIWLVVLGALAGFLALAEDVWNKDIMDGDQIGYALISSLSAIPGMTDFVRTVTHLGDPAAYVVMTLIMLTLFRHKHITRVIILNVINVGLLNLMLKYILRRPRPLGPHLVAASGFSFPSGHAMGSLAFYGLFMYLIYLYVPNRKLRWAGVLFMAIIIGCIGMSRIYLGVHYTSDVLGGYFISLAYLIVYIRITRHYYDKQKEDLHD